MKPKWMASETRAMWIMGGIVLVVAILFRESIAGYLAAFNFGCATVMTILDKGFYL